MANTNDTTNWERRLKGEVIPLDSTMEPDYGFYRVRSKDRTSWRPIAYWYVHGVLNCALGAAPNVIALDRERALAIWPAASKNAITHELYKAVAEEGKPWPDENSVVTQSNRAPDDDSFEAIQERIDDLAREADRLIKKGAAGTQEDADQAANVATKLGEYWTKADNIRKVEKNPHKTAAEAVDNKWRPLLTAADIHKELKDVVCAPWLRAQKKKKEAEDAEAARVAKVARDAAIAAQEEARRAQDEALQTGDVATIAEAGLLAVAAEEKTKEAVSAIQTAQQVARTTVTVGTTGRGVHLRAAPDYIVGDRDAMFTYLKTNPKAIEEIDAVMLKHAKAISKAGIVVPGLTKSEGSQAA